MLIDTHCHLNMMVKKEFDTPLNPSTYVLIDEILKTALESDITYILNVGTSHIESINSIEIARRFPMVFATIGIHPNDATAQWREDIQHFASLVSDTKNKIVAIGECGIDKHYPNYNLALQQDVFKAQIELALEYNLPLVIHMRNASDETLSCLESFKDPKLRGVLHCFSETQSFAHDARALGFVLGIGGTVTYPKNTILQSLVQEFPLESIILETDAPFLPPQVMRGKQNHPRTIAIIAEYIAQLRNIPVQEVADITTRTACQLFSLY